MRWLLIDKDLLSRKDAKLPLLLTPLTYIPVGKGAKENIKITATEGTENTEEKQFKNKNRSIYSLSPTLSATAPALLYLLHPCSRPEGRGG
jgi:hypothetical protein